MKINFNKICLSVGILSTLMFGGCGDSIDPLVNEIDFNRTFSPVELAARIRNRTTVELSCDVAANVEKYVIEFAEDSLLFQSIVRTVEVSGEDVPYSVALMGETQYSARVKAVITGKEDSKWSVVAFKTDLENIFNTVSSEDIAATSVRLSWPAASEVTHVIITPGEIRHDLTADEIAAGEVSIIGLTGETGYTAKLYKDSKVRGTVSFRTTVDIGNAIAVRPNDDLKAMLENAETGDVFALFPGDYSTSQGKITITKSISIKGVRPDDRPILHNQFILGGNISIELRDLFAVGDGVDELGVSTTDHFIQVATSGVTEVGSIVVEGCVIRKYSKSLLAAGSGAFTVSSVLFNNCVISDILTNGADFIDFRTSSACASLTLSNSTFNNCAVARDFIRMDNATGFAAISPNILIDHCTFYKVSDPAKRILYVRKAGHTITVRKSIFAQTTGYYSNQSSTNQPVCDTNNYFNAIDFLPTSTVASVKTDQSGTYTTLDPGFGDVANGNFKVSDQTLIDGGIGDPRWLQ